MLKIITHSAAFFMILGNLMAERQIVGLVSDSATGQPIEGVNISTEKGASGTSTDKEGRFTLAVTSADTILIVEHIAYDRSLVTVRPADTELMVRLIPKIIPLSELNVLGDTGRGEFSQLETKNMVTGIKVKDISIRGYSDIGDVLLNEESVLISETSTGEKTLSIRGARQEEMVYMYDGVRMHNGGRRSLDLSMFDSGGLEAVELLRGGHENGAGSSGTINFVPRLAYKTSASLFQRFGTYNTGNYHTGFSLGNSVISLGFSSGEGRARQFYESAESADILRDNSGHSVSAGYRPFSSTELKYYQVKSGRVYNNYYTGDSIGSRLLVNTVKLEQDAGTMGQMEIYVSSQSSTGEDLTRQLQTERDDSQLITGLNYLLPIDNAYVELFLSRSLIGADWTTSIGDISLEREHISASGVFGLSQEKTKDGFEIKDFVVNINSNIVEENTGTESNILKGISSWNETGATAAVSAWDHTDNTILYLFANIGNNFRVPSIAERYAHALRPDAFEGDTLLTEYKIMKEAGLKLSSIDPDASPSFTGSMSYFHYGYTNKIKNIQYSRTPLQFPVNFGSAYISGVELNMQVYTLNKRLGYRSVYSAYNFSDQLTFPMQPLTIARHNIIFNLGPVNARIGLKTEGSRIMTTVDEGGSLVDNYLKEHTSLDVNLSCRIKFRDTAASVGIFGQNLNDDSQALEGISIYDKRVYLSMGLEWR